MNNDDIKKKYMNLSSIDKAFFDAYSSNIAQCSDEYLLEFIEISNESHPDWDNFPSEYYSHLMDAHIAFGIGVEYGRKNP